MVRKRMPFFTKLTPRFCQIAALRAGIALYQNDLPRTIDLARRALADLPLEHTRPRGRMMLRLGPGQFWSGTMVVSGQTLAQASRLSIVAGDLLTALAALYNEAAVPYPLPPRRHSAAWRSPATDRPHRCDGCRHRPR